MDAKPYPTDLAKARALMAEAGVSGKIETTLSFDASLATTCEPMAILIQEALKEIGIEAQLNKVQGAVWRTELGKKSMPLYLARFGSWLQYPDYILRVLYGSSSFWNAGDYQNPKLESLIDKARSLPFGPEYDEAVAQASNLLVAELPVTMLVRPAVDVAMRKPLAGYQYWFHREPDFRFLQKA